MRFRTTLLLLALVLLAAFVALNANEFARISTLNLGITTIALPLGLVMLVLLVATLAVALASLLVQQSRHALQSRTHTRELNAQRELADKAEASRFSELRSYLEIQTLASQQRDTALETALADRLAQQQKVLMARIDKTDNTVAAYLGQMEDKLLGSHVSTDSGKSALTTNRNPLLR